jgi:hypothetical protein
LRRAGASVSARADPTFASSIEETTFMGNAHACSCRLCGSEALPQFSLLVLHKYEVQYFLCSGCKSMQTEEPYWLEEAYSAPSPARSGDRSTANLNDLDTGAAQRVLSNLPATMRVAKALNARNIVDRGGGDGLLCRLLRDHGLNAFVNDPHASPTYAPSFTIPDFDRPDLMTAFEVFEHLSHPAQELGEMFARAPGALLATTLTYSGQGPDWWYLIPTTGHHIFFYSEEALQLIAERHGYELMRPGGYILFVKPGRLGPRQRRFLELAMRGKPLRLYRAMLSLRNPVPETAVSAPA